MPAKKMQVLQDSSMRNCIGCDVLVQKDETNEQNISFHRLEMAERWRLQEKTNADIQGNIEKLVTTQTGHVDRMHKLEKNIIYATIANAAAAAIAVGSRFIR